MNEEFVVSFISSERAEAVREERERVWREAGAMLDAARTGKAVT